MRPELQPTRGVVLLADDSMTILAMVAARLERAGYDVVTTTRGDEALELMHELQPVLAVLDLEMPGLNGIEVTEAIRADGRLAHTLIILLTSHATAEAVEIGVRAGVNDYVTKPFSPQELEGRIERLLVGV
jgi:DNA-binding response OmpR family regulator